MGLDCPNVRRVIHWGASNDVEAYIQETGRARRDGEPAEAHCILYQNQFVEESMKEYTKNNEMCRREILLKDFDGSVGVCTSSCSCCDVCESKCTCTNFAQVLVLVVMFVKVNVHVQIALKNCLYNYALHNYYSESMQFRNVCIFLCKFKGLEKFLRQTSYVGICVGRVQSLFYNNYPVYT